MRPKSPVKMTRHVQIVCFVAVVVMTGCKMTLSDDAEAAYIPKLNQHQKAIVEQAVSELLYGRQVSLANTVFEENNKLQIERNIATDQRGVPIEGRLGADSIYLFTLWLDDTVCWIKRNDTNTSIPLEDAQCAAVK